MARNLALLAVASLVFALAPAHAQKTPIESLFENPLQGPVDALPKTSAAELIRQERLALVAGRRHATDQELAQLSGALDAGMYPEVAAFVRSHAGEPKMVQWALARAKAGNVPMMWELAELYAFDGAEEQAVKWAYAAIIGALQERALCLHAAGNQGPAKIAAEHPRVVALARANPHWTREAKAFAMALLSSPLPYPSPEVWLCKPYSPRRANKRGPQQAVAYEAIYFPILRARARNKLRAELDIPGGPEQEPPMPAPARRR